LNASEEFSVVHRELAVTGAAKPAVTVIEFSDFECPSCLHAASYMKPILQKYPDQVLYVRYDCRW